MIRRRYPNVNIVLHPDMPLSSIDKMVELAPVVDAVNKLEPRIESLTDKDLCKKSAEFSKHVLKKSGQYQSEIRELEELLLSVAIPEEKGKIKERLKLARNKIFSDILIEAFAVVREASRRTIGMRHFDVQIAGGVVLHEGRAAEMATGEGKTLVATLPAYLNALLKRGVHIITVNDYLARRDTTWMGPIYEFLGLSVGVIQHGMSDEERKKAYACDVTYGTNNEFGFDYLRDNMKYSWNDLAQRPFYYAIVDEVDSILVDEARTPLIISGPAEESTDKYHIVDKVVPRLKGRIILERDEITAKYKGEDLSRGYDYIVDEKTHTAHLTEEGESKACSILEVANLHDINTMDWRHHIIAALRAHNLFKRDVDYVVKDGQVIIVDEFTGRLMPGRRWSDGLHQAVEAKEGLKIERENQTLATITFQNYFRMYEKLAGMTGTAFSEAQEFKAIYQLDVVVISTNRPLIRTRHPDCVYKTQEEKFNAVVEEIVSLHQQGRPVLVGTISIEKSERLSEMLKRRGISHQVLNAKYHEQEAQIVAQAGRYQAVTIATNMAGRGTDIILGGNPEYMSKNLLKDKELLSKNEPNHEEEYRKTVERFRKETEEEHRKVVNLGGLHVLGTERHEARRIDNQLRGRAGRQGDPGSSRFYVALADDLMRLFGSDRLIGIMDKLGLQEGQVIEHPWVSKSIEIAQRRVEEHNFEIRKQVLEYDNVMNKQREVIYTQRRQLLEGSLLSERISEMMRAAIEICCENHLSKADQESDDLTGLVNALYLKFGVKINKDDLSGRSLEQIQDRIYDILTKAYAEKQEVIGVQAMQHFQQMVLLQIIDSKWKDHLYAMDDLREGIGLRAIGQRDPLIEYKREAFMMFDQMITAIQEDAIEMLFKIQPVAQERIQGVFRLTAQELLHPEVSRFQRPEGQPAEELPHRPGPLQPPPSRPVSTKTYPKVGRNDPCPCGATDPKTGKPIKYKKCHGR